MKRFARAVCLALLAVGYGWAGEIIEGRVFTVPERIYVNQPFELRCELVVTFGCEVEDIRLTGIPVDSDALIVEPMRKVSQTREARGANRSVTVILLSAEGRAKRPVDTACSPALSCSLLERRTSGFFSHWAMSPQRKALSPFLLKIEPLPEAGRPDGFSGAIGQFRLSGALSQQNVRPQDIVTLTVRLSGSGWLGEGATPTPPASELFKIYPAKTVVHEPLRRTTEQVWIPMSTNATEIGKVTFSYFNPQSGRYETVQAGPFRLTFTDRPETNAVSTVKVIQTDLTKGSGDSVPAVGISLAQVNQSVRHSRPLLAVAASVLIALFVLFTMIGRHTVWGIVSAALLIGIGCAVGAAMNRQERHDVQTLSRRCEVRFAPSARSVTLFTLNPGVEVVPLERAGEWTRIDADGRRGWIERME